MTTEEVLINKYGPLMTMDEVAELLKRSPQGLRVMLGRDNKLSNRLNESKKRIGRRIYFPTITLVGLIDGHTEAV